MTPRQILDRSIRALGGTWDTRRAVTALSDAGHGTSDQRAAEKAARHALRQLARTGLITKTNDRPVAYRPAGQ